VLKIAVTGAHGFVGLNVVKALASQGHGVIAVSRREPDAWVTAFLTDCPGVEHVVADVSVPGELRSALSDRKLDAVVHAAVVTATTLQVEKDEAARIIHVNTGGTIEAMEAARVAGASRFVYVSSPSAIGDAAKNADMDESVGKRPESLYGISKDASEEITRRYGWLHGISVASVRIAQPYGPGERATASRVRTSPIYEWLLDAEAERPLPAGPLDRARDWTYIDDTARGIAQLATAHDLQHDLYHLSLGQQITVGAVLEEIKATYPRVIWNEAPQPDDLNPNISGPSGRKPLDSSRFRSEFGWSPSIRIEEGMNRYLNWWKSFPVSTS
jgi:nucleoside-diphosphate-sugar epimerase